MLHIKGTVKRTGINQGDISRLKNSTRKPTVSLLKRLAGREDYNIDDMLYIPYN